MTKDSAAAMIACRSQRVDCAFEAVEDMGHSAQSNLKGFVVGVTADFARFHEHLLLRLGEEFR
jgi:hypothetical protein